MDLYSEVTQRVLSALRDGTATWRQPWGSHHDTGTLGIPVNAKTKKPYNGINVMLLWLAGYQSPYWATERVWQTMGANVLPGHCPTKAYLFMFLNGRGNKRVPYFKEYPLYNLQQVEGCDSLRTKQPEVVDWMPAETLIRASKAVFVKGSEAFYDLKLDRIICPDKELFKSTVGYVTTRLHELAHWTGHQSRLNRTFGLNRKTPEYAFEELVAEIASCFLAAALKVPEAIGEMPNHANYLAAWLSILGEDHRAIFRAAAQAQKSANYLLSFVGKKP